LGVHQSFYNALKLDTQNNKTCGVRFVEKTCRGRFVEKQKSDEEFCPAGSGYENFGYIELTDDI
jgi:hypothetical protein